MEGAAVMTYDTIWNSPLACGTEKDALSAYGFSATFISGNT